MGRKGTDSTSRRARSPTAMFHEFFGDANLFGGHGVGVGGGGGFEAFDMGGLGDMGDMGGFSSMMGGTGGTGGQQRPKQKADVVEVPVKVRSLVSLQWPEVVLCFKEDRVSDHASLNLIGCRCSAHWRNSSLAFLKSGRLRVGCRIL